MSNTNITYIGNEDKYNEFTEVKIFCTALPISELRKCNLPKNSLIISSPIDKTNGNDIGTPSMIMSDSFGNILPLTYTLTTKNPLGIQYIETNNTCILSNK